MLQCVDCKTMVPGNCLGLTNCCSQLKCGSNCANPCDNDCKKWLCNLRTDDLKNQTCFGFCPKNHHLTQDASIIFTKELFHDEADYEVQLQHAIRKFSGKDCFDLNCLEQLLVSTILDISKQYPQFQFITSKNPFQ